MFGVLTESVSEQQRIISSYHGCLFFGNNNDKTFVEAFDLRFYLFTCTVCTERMLVQRGHRSIERNNHTHMNIYIVVVIQQFMHMVCNVEYNMIRVDVVPGSRCSSYRYRQI